MGPGGILQILKDGGPYGVAALSIAAMLGVFWFYKSAMDDRINDFKERAKALESQVLGERAATAAVQTAKDSQSERLLVAADRVVQVQSALERLIPKPKPPRDGP